MGVPRPKLRHQPPVPPRRRVLAGRVVLLRQPVRGDARSGGFDFECWELLRDRVERAHVDGE